MNHYLSSGTNLEGDICNLGIEKRIGYLTIAIFLVIAIISIMVILTSQYRNNNVTIIGADVFEQRLSSDLNLDDKMYILTSKSSIERKLSKLGYIGSYSVEKSSPNNVSITVTLDDVVFCSDEYLFFDDYVVNYNDNYSVYCNCPTLIGDEAVVDSIISEYLIINESIRSRITQVEIVDETEVHFMIDDTQILLNLSSARKLNEYIDQFYDYSYEGDVLDLRLKYD